MSLAAVRDLREVRSAVGPEELAEFETDVLAGFGLARAAAELIARQPTRRPATKTATSKKRSAPSS